MANADPYTLTALFGGYLCLLGFLIWCYYVAFNRVWPSIARRFARKRKRQHSVDKWRTPEAQQYRKLYQGKPWRTLREKALTRDLFTCQRCGVSLKRGRSHPQSAVVHHIKAHKGDYDLFHDINNLQSVCWSCHSGAIQSEEARGYSTQIGEDGWPKDPNHPGA